VNTEGDFRNQHELEKLIPNTTIVAKTPEFTRKLTMAGKHREFQAKGSSLAVFAEKVDGTIMQLNRAVSHRQSDAGAFRLGCKV